MTLRAVLLDVDGTLVDSNDLHAEAWVEVLMAHRHAVSFAHVRRLIGMGSDKLVPEVTGLEADSAEARPIVDERKRIFLQRCLPKVRAFPGARELLVRMRERGLKLVVASSAARDELDALLERAGIADLLRDTTSSDDAEHSKPDPDIVQAALRQARVAASDALMLGDTPYDVEAAGRAQVQIVAFRSGGWDDAGLRGASAIFDGPQDLLARYDASPLTS